jgi:signal transduction histidine kinase
MLNTLYKEQRTVEPVLADLNELIGYVNEKVTEPGVRDEILKYLTRINTQYGEVKEILIKSANAGLNLGVVIHEIEKIIGSLTGAVDRNDREKSISLSQRLEKIVKGYSAMIKKSDIRLTSLKDPIDTVLDNFEYRFKDHKIKVISNHSNNTLKGFLALSEAISVLTNLLDNSIYWLKYARKEDRSISIFITDQIKVAGQPYNSIIISDNGPGFNIPPEIAVRPFITGKPHNVGSGLGLHVASQMMHAMNGHILFLDKYEIDLPPIVKTGNVDMAIIALCFPIKK